PSSHGSSTPTEPHVNTKSISASNATNSSVGKTSTTPNQSTPIVNTGRQGHIHPQRKHTLLGGNRTAQRARHFLSRTHNTGYDIGQKMNRFKGKIQQSKQVKIEKRGLRSDEVRDTERD